MKRILLAIVMFTLVGQAKADIKYNDRTNRFYSLPATPDIDQREYNDLCIQIALRMSTCSKTTNWDTFGQEIFSYLKMLNTPTAHRLGGDLLGLSFLEIGLAFTMYASASHDFKTKLCKDVPWYLDREQYYLIYVQMIMTVIMSWNSGVYGNPVLEGIRRYVKSIDSRESRYIVSYVGL